MNLQIINIVDRLDKVNYGIWQAAIATADVLFNTYNIKTELWYPEANEQLPEYQYGSVKLVPVGKDIPVIENPSQTIVVTHGCWQYPTRWGFALHNRGIKWVYVPHGMLESWSMHQKWVRKQVYFNLVEKVFSKRADIVRAVGKPEYINLKKIYKNVVHIPNGSKSKSFQIKNWEQQPLQFLFLARLHKKKGISPLVNAWKNSLLNNNPKFKLTIAGPDDGELKVLNTLLANGTNNIEYAGLAYGEVKDKLLQESHFFILPSFSEGFPTSVVEAMQYGLIPVISEGCNFPEVFEQNLAYKIAPDFESIKAIIECLIVQSSNEMQNLSKNCHDFISEKYSLEVIAKNQFNMYKNLFIEQ